MAPEIKQNDDNWQETISAFHAYLQNTVKLLANKPDLTKADKPSIQNQRIAAASPKKAKTKSAVKQSIILDPALEDTVKAAFQLSKTKDYSSPLWVNLGNEDSGQIPTKAKRKKKTKQ